jgi:chromosome segregation ATPase
MVDTTDIEKKSLEAHVELCAERYRLLELKLETVDEKITQANQGIEALNNLVTEMTNRRNDQIMNWGVGAMAIMLGIIGWFAVEYLNRL